MACIADLIDVDRKVVRPHAVRAAGVSGAVAVSALAMIRPDILHGAEREVGHHGRPAMLVWRRAPAACQGRERGGTLIRADLDEAAFTLSGALHLRQLLGGRLSQAMSP